MGWLFRDLETSDDPEVNEWLRLERAGDELRKAERRGRGGGRWWSLLRHVADGAGAVVEDGAEVAGSVAQRAYGAAQRATDVDDWRRAADEMVSGSWSIWRGDR